MDHGFTLGPPLALSSFGSRHQWIKMQVPLGRTDQVILTHLSCSASISLLGLELWAFRVLGTWRQVIKPLVVG